MPSCLGSKMRLNGVVRLNSAIKMENTSAVTSKDMQSKDTSEQAFWWQKCLGKAFGNPGEHSLWREIHWPVLGAIGLSFRDSAIWSVRFWFGDNCSGFCRNWYLLSPENLHLSGSPVLGDLTNESVICLQTLQGKVVLRMCSILDFQDFHCLEKQLTFSLPFWLFWDRVFFILGCPQTPYIAMDGSSMLDPPASTPKCWDDSCAPSCFFFCSPVLFQIPMSLPHLITTLTAF